MAYIAGQNPNQKVTDCTVIWEPLATVNALITQLGIAGTATASTKADGSVKVVGLSSWYYAAMRGVNVATQGEEAFIVT